MDLSSSRKPPNLDSLVPISKNIKPNQIYNDYSFPIFSCGKMIVSSSMEKSRLSKSNRELSTVKYTPGHSKGNVVQRALEERKSKRFNTMNTRIVPELNLFFSKKPRIVDFVPYSVKSYKELSVIGDMGGLGSSRIGGTEWENEKQKQQRIKFYANRLKKKAYIT